jgi:hypothetical protein
MDPLRGRERMFILYSPRKKELQKKTFLPRKEHEDFREIEGVG